MLSRAVELTHMPCESTLVSETVSNILDMDILYGRAEGIDVMPTERNDPACRILIQGDQNHPLTVQLRNHCQEDSFPHRVQATTGSAGDTSELYEGQ